MRTRGQMPFHVAVSIGLLLVTVAYEIAITAEGSVEESSQAERGPGPIPPDSPLARPKSLRQTVVPVEATPDSVPRDTYA